MRLTVVGSGTLRPDADRGPAALLVEAAGARFLVDGGSGTLRTLARLGVEAASLDGGVISHRHLDHVAELPTLFFLYSCFGRDRPYRLFGGGGLVAHVERLEAVHGSLREGFEVPMHELSLSGPDEAELAPGLVLRTAPARHSRGALHLAFEADGQRFVFSGDTGPSVELARLAAGADLLVTECAVATPSEYHLRPEDVAALVAEARPRRVVLTHLYPEVDPDRALRTVAATGVPVERADDGRAYDSSASRRSR